MKALKCRECSREYPLGATHVCEFDFGPLEVAYDYERIRQSLTRDKICSRPQNMWRYRELLPIAGEPTVGAKVGYTPLIKADRLAARLGIRELWIKNDAVNYPTLSFKDRVVSVALSRSVELGCCGRGPPLLRFHSLGPRAGQGRQFSGLRGECRGDPGSL